MDVAVDDNDADAVVDADAKLTGVKHGWFSFKHREAYGSVLYSTPDGSVVEITIMSYDQTSHGTAYTDVEYVGEVTAYISNLIRPRIGYEYSDLVKSMVLKYDP